MVFFRDKGVFLKGAKTDGVSLYFLVFQLDVFVEGQQDIQACPETIFDDVPLGLVRMGLFVVLQTGLQKYVDGLFDGTGIRMVGFSECFAKKGG